LTGGVHTPRETRPQGRVCEWSGSEAHTVGELVRARIRVSGMVQGVGYRYFVRNAAIALGLDGSVRNMPDGSVEVVAEGEQGMVDGLIRQLRVGPRHASVDGVDVRWEAPRKDFSGFDYAF
jgi:acylphosphatase